MNAGGVDEVEAGMSLLGGWCVDQICVGRCGCGGSSLGEGVGRLKAQVNFENSVAGRCFGSGRSTVAKGSAIHAWQI